jgi:quercetin dioxygenase-like cupin family protein
MHVTPSELRILQQDGTLIRFALLGGMAYILADVPPTGSAGTPLEQPCTKPHWGFVHEGDVTFESAAARQPIPPGSAFHVPPGGPPHRFLVNGAARVSGFEPIDPVADVSDRALVEQGFELIAGEPGSVASVIPANVEPIAKGSGIDARTWRMSSLVLTQARFGPGSGYLNDWCDAPHWGLVTSGRLAIEWEDDIEIVAAGDIFHCPAGPPGHRLEAADPAAIIDLTPVADLLGAMRLAPWREAPTGRNSLRDHTSIAVAGLG